jgi:hypothetical protein
MNRSQHISALLCIVLAAGVIFQIAAYQVCLEGDKYTRPRCAFVFCCYGDLSDALDNQITSSVHDWLMALVEFVMLRVKGSIYFFLFVRAHVSCQFFSWSNNIRP